MTTFVVNDPDAGEYNGYVVEGLDDERYPLAEELDPRLRRAAVRRRLRRYDEQLGVAVKGARCTCYTSVAGDYIDVGACERHGVVAFCVSEVCYCSDKCECGWSRLSEKQLSITASL